AWFVYLFCRSYIPSVLIIIRSIMAFKKILPMCHHAFIGVYFCMTSLANCHSVSGNTSTHSGTFWHDMVYLFSATATTLAASAFSYKYQLPSLPIKTTSYRSFWCFPFVIRFWEQHYLSPCKTLIA